MCDTPSIARTITSFIWPHQGLHILYWGEHNLTAVELRGPCAHTMYICKKAYQDYISKDARGSHLALPRAGIMWTILLRAEASSSFDGAERNRDRPLSRSLCRTPDRPRPKKKNNNHHPCNICAKKKEMLLPTPYQRIQVHDTVTNILLSSSQFLATVTAPLSYSLPETDCRPWDGVSDLA